MLKVSTTRRVQRGSRMQVKNFKTEFRKEVIADVSALGGR